MSGGRDQDETASAAPARAASAVGRGAGLFLVARGDQPLAAVARLRLVGLDEVQLRRGDALDARGRGDTWELTVPDREISSRHARVTRIGGGWVVEDSGSKNGTFINGARVKVAALADGDVLELGRAVLIYREQIAQDGVRFFQPPARARRGLASLLPAIQADLDALAPMAAAPITILVEGETGTGKELVARNIHALSGRPGDFVAVNCGALARERVEAELFGWKRGAFTGASDHLGLVRSADRGTLFLDEIGDLPLRDQAALLRVLQEREVLPIGATRAVAVELRVIAATNRPLDAMVAAGSFRDDLLARLTGFRLALTPLRARREDLGILVADILRERAGDDGGGVTLTTEAVRALLRHGWPGNIRELDHAIVHALVQRGASATLEVDHLPPAVLGAGPGAAANAAGELAAGATTAAAAPLAHAAALAAAPLTDGDEAIRARLHALLREHHGNTAAVARAMGKAPMQIWRWRKRFGLDDSKERG